MTLLPLNDVESALVRLEDDRFTCELRRAQLELRTPPCATVAGACRELAAARAFAADRLAGFARIAAAGLHPTSRLPIEVTDCPRYRRIALDCPWSLREGLPSGLHVHVAVWGPDRALAVYNAARSFLPELAALAANSPFLGGVDTGVASARLKLNETFPRSGVPPAFASWEEYEAFVDWGRTGGLFPDSSHLWWDLRLHPGHGTLEFRIADAQTRVEEAAAVACSCQALAATLAARWGAGELLPLHELHRIAENRSRAIGGGLGGTLVDLDTGVPVGTREQVARLLALLEPAAGELDCRDELLAAWALLAENGAERQRRIAARSGLGALVGRLADDTEGKAAAPLEHAGATS